MKPEASLVEARMGESVCTEASVLEAEKRCGLGEEGWDEAGTAGQWEEGGDEASRQVTSG